MKPFYTVKPKVGSFPFTRGNLVFSTQNTSRSKGGGGLFRVSREARRVFRAEGILRLMLLVSLERETKGPRPKKTNTLGYDRRLLSTDRHENESPIISKKKSRLIILIEKRESYIPNG